MRQSAECRIPHLLSRSRRYQPIDLLLEHSHQVRPGLCVFNHGHTAQLKQVGPFRMPQVQSGGIVGFQERETA